MYFSDLRFFLKQILKLKVTRIISEMYLNVFIMLAGEIISNFVSKQISWTHL